MALSKSLTYNTTEAADRTSTLQGIIDMYFPDGVSTDDTNAILCCLAQEECDDVDNNGDGQVDEHQVNEWIGPDNGYWHDNAAYWSLCHVPNSCNEVIISAPLTVNVRAGNIGHAYSITVISDAALIVEEGGEVIIQE